MKRNLAVLAPTSFLFGGVWVEPPIRFADANLRAAEAQLWVSDPAPAEMLELTSLRAADRGIAAISSCTDASDPTRPGGARATGSGDIIKMDAYRGTTHARESLLGPWQQHQRMCSRTTSRQSIRLWCQVVPLCRGRFIGRRLVQ